MGYLDILHEHRASDGRPEGQLVLDWRSTDPGGILLSQRRMTPQCDCSHLFDEEATNLALFAILNLPCPDDKKASDWRIRDPGL